MRRRLAGDRPISPTQFVGRFAIWSEANLHGVSAAGAGPEERLARFGFKVAWLAKTHRVGKPSGRYPYSRPVFGSSGSSGKSLLTSWSSRSGNFLWLCFQ